MEHIELWNMARKLKLGTAFYEGLDTLLNKIESDNKQLILHNVSNNEARVSGCDHVWIMGADAFDQTCYCKKCGKSD